MGWVIGILVGTILVATVLDHADRGFDDDDEEIIELMDDTPPNKGKKTKKKQGK